MAKVEAVTTTAAVLGAVLATIRNEAGLKQSDVADHVGIGASTWSRIEKGESTISVEQLKLAAKALAVTPSYILGMAEIAEKDIALRGVRIEDTTSPTKFSIGRVAAGAAGGAALGTVIPVFGTALGLLVGATIGHLLGSTDTDET